MQEVGGLRGSRPQILTSFSCRVIAVIVTPCACVQMGIDDWQVKRGGRGLGRWGYDLTAASVKEKQGTKQSRGLHEEACVGKPKDREKYAC